MINFLKVKEDDFKKIKEIYDWYINNSTTTFHTEPIKIEELREYIYIDHPTYQSYMIHFDEEIVGYCLLTNFKKRQAYDRTAEATIYLHPDVQRKGIGMKALKFLEEKAKETNIKNLLGVITSENQGSITLFEKVGYTKCAHFKNVGEKFGRVLDVVAYQKEL